MADTNTDTDTSNRLYINKINVSINPFTLARLSCLRTKNRVELNTLKDIKDRISQLTPHDINLYKTNLIKLDKYALLKTGSIEDDFKQLDNLFNNSSSSSIELVVDEGIYENINGNDKRLEDADIAGINKYWDILGPDDFTNNISNGIIKDDKLNTIDFSKYDTCEKIIHYIFLLYDNIYTCNYEGLQDKSQRHFSGVLSLGKKVSRGPGFQNMPIIKIPYFIINKNNIDLNFCKCVFSSVDFKIFLKKQFRDPSQEDRRALFKERFRLKQDRVRQKKAEDKLRRLKNAEKEGRITSSQKKVLYSIRDKWQNMFDLRKAAPAGAEPSGGAKKKRKLSDMQKSNKKNIIFNNFIKLLILDIMHDLKSTRTYGVIQQSHFSYSNKHLTRKEQLKNIKAIYIGCGIINDDDDIQFVKQSNADAQQNDTKFLAKTRESFQKNVDIEDNINIEYSNIFLDNNDNNENADYFDMKSNRNPNSLKIDHDIINYSNACMKIGHSNLYYFNLAHMFDTGCENDLIKIP